MKQGMKKDALRGLVMATTLLASVFALAAPTGTPAGTVLLATQGAKAVGTDGAARDLVRRAPIYTGDRLVTGSNARVQVKFSDGSVMGLKPNTEMSLDKYAYEDKGAQAMFMSLVKGGFRTVTGAIGKLNKQDYRISTPVATIGVRGTLHEADFNPQSGLALGVWDGGIQACNSGGCLDLGMNSDYRFGFIGLDGRAQGRNTPPPGIGGGDGQPAGDDQGSDVIPDLGNLADATQGLFVGNGDEFLHGNLPPTFSGFAVVGNPLSPATAYPWGHAQLLKIDDAMVEFNDGLSAWSLKSADAGGYINPGYTGDGVMPSMPFYSPTADGEGLLVWGSWTGEFLGQTQNVLHDISVGSEAGVTSTTGIPAAGAFIFGTPLSNESLATLSGQIDFLLLFTPDIQGAQFPHFVDASGFVQSATNASGQVSVNVTSGDVSGNLDFDTALNGSWHLALDGNYSSHNVNLGVVTGADGTTNGSWYMPVGGQTGSELGVGGTVETDLVGSGSDIGLIGGFNVETLNAADTNYANGIFFMSRLVPQPTPDFVGFAAVAGPGGTVYYIDNARVLTGPDPTDTQPPIDEIVLDGSMHIAGLNQYLLPGCECSPGVLTTPPEDPVLIEKAVGTSTLRAIYGYWMGNDMSLSSVDNGLVTNQTIADPGAYLFGDWASPSVIANMTGTVVFGLESPFPLYADAAGQQTGATGALGAMTVDVTSGTVSGNLSMTTAQSDVWAINYDGTFAQQSLALNVLTDAVTPVNGSHFIDAGGAGGPLAVSGSIQAQFVGTTEVVGTVGSFDVQASNGTDFARGVYLMSVSPAALP